MKARLNLTIDNQLLDQMKRYASKQETSVSELVESYFKTLTKKTKNKNILDLVEKLEKPAIDTNADLKALFYKEQSKRYGF